MRHRNTTPIAGTALLSACLACTDHVGQPDPWIADSAGLVVQVLIEPSGASLVFVDDSVALTATALNPAGYPLPARVAVWATGDTGVVHVSSRGVARAAGRGVATISGTIGGVTGTATLTVEPGIVVRNGCTRCHWARRPGGHFAWGFAESTCLACHDTTGAGHEEVRRDHHAVAGFVLSGVHAGLPCEACHLAGTDSTAFSPAGHVDCAACHRADYDARHGADGYPLACLWCHTEASWAGAVFAHEDASGGYELTAVHGAISCLACHDATTFQPRWTPAGPMDCYACHAGDYAAQHAAQGYPTTCLLCHAEATWAGASFSHATASGGYSLTGPHVSLACTACHDAVTWAPKWNPASRTDCSACHGVT